ncbi:MAG TPA: tyrosine-type recombinase/integrase [Burkholderiales bacterium]|nr:tyrosine-type recombinase/integrase [Burkholderiales bacterium]
MEPEVHGNGVEPGGFRYPPFVPSPTARANRRRLLVFVGVFVAVAAIGLGYTFLRPAEYRASARVQITPAGEVARIEAPPGAAAGSPKPFLTEVEVLASRPVLGDVVARLNAAGEQLTEFGPDPIEGIRSSLDVVPVAGTNVVEIAARGPRPEALAAVVNNVVDVYRERLASAYRSESGEAMAQAAEEAQRLESSVLAKRRDVEAFRTRNNIVSLERDENQVLAQVKGLGASLNAANEHVAAAEGKVRSLTESTAAGKGTARARDDPTLANLEQRASQIREELRELERTFTPDYLAMDPKARAMRSRLAELDQQIKVQREAGQRAGLRDAEEELAAAREAARRIQQQMAGGRQEVTQFTARFNEYKSLQEDLAQLEKAYRDAVERRAKLEATERARTPTVRMLEAAAVPREVWRPLYLRDAGISIAAAILLALAAMWIVELFNRPEPQPAVVIAQPVVSGMLVHGGPQPVALPGQRHVALEAPELALLQHQTMHHAILPRELGSEEIQAIVRDADHDERLAMLLLLHGVAPDELVQLRWTDIDLEQRVVRVRGESAREIPVGDALERELTVGPASADQPLFTARGDRPAMLSDIESAFLYAAHDAGIERPSELTPAALRHTYVAFLVRQGIRFADLARLVGAIPPAELAAYGALTPVGPRVAFEAIQLVLPALRMAAPDRSGPS